MKLYLEDLPEQFRSMNKVYGAISIEHEMVPFRQIDVTVKDGTQRWNMVDVITAKNTLTDEQIQFKASIADVPYKTSTGYLIKGVNRQLAALYEMSKGWHFGENSNDKQLEDVLSKRMVKFLPDISLSEYANHYSFCVDKGVIKVQRGKKFVKLSIFLKALTGLSYSSLIEKIGVTNKYIISTFSCQEYSRVKCIDIANTLFAKKDEKIKDILQYQEERDVEVPDVSKVVSFVNNFTGINAMMGNGAERTKELFSFRNIKNCFLAHPAVLGAKVIPAGSKLTPELLMELDYSCIDILRCNSPGSNKAFTFKKYDIYNFRGLNKGATDTIEQLRAAEAKGSLEYKLSTGEVIKRLPVPNCNTENIIFNVLNLYVNYLNGFDINSNVYDMANQSVTPLEQEISKLVTERLSIINYKAKELSEQDNADFTVKNLPAMLISFNDSTLIERYIGKKGKSVPLSSVENSLGVVAQNNLIVKDVSRAQGDMVVIQDTQMGRLDPFDVPENKNVGLTHNRAFLSRVCSNSQLEAPFVQVSDCRVVSDIVYLSTTQEKDQYIGEWNEDFSKEVTVARYNGMLVKVHPSKLNYLEASPFQHSSAARALSPFMECMSGKRALMSASQAKQAIAIVGAERPLINSGAESLITSMDGAVKPFITARDLIEEYCMTNYIDYNDIKQSVLYYNTFEDNGTERIHHLSFNCNGAMCSITKHLPDYQPTNSKTIYGFVLNMKDSLEYQDEDIVFHSLTYDARKYKRNDSINEGALKADPKVYETGMALGLNLHVGYMTYEGVTIDDAFLLNDRLVTEDRLSHIFIYQENYEIGRLEGKEETFGFIDGRVLNGYELNGLPCIGAYLAPGSIVINKFIMRLKEDGSSYPSDSGYTTNIELPATIGGQVVATQVIGGTKAVVTIVALSKMEVGDKMAGRYGNKGVCAKVVPNYLMPYDPATGRAFDIVLNPLGIPSRINLSQVLEVTYAACNKKEGTIAVVTPFQQGFIDKIKADAEKLGIKPIRPVNPKTGLRTEYAVHVGEIYMYKLTHTVRGKLRSVGVTNEVDAVFKQPVGTGKSKAKGQAFGELESWCAMSAECFEFLEEVQTVLSEDLEARKIAQEQISDHPGPVDLDFSTFKNSNGKHLRTFYKASGIKVTQNPEDTTLVKFEPMSDEDIQSLNPINPLNVNDAKNSLRNPTIFKDGKYSSKDIWSWMDLGGEILNPFWIKRGAIYKCVVLTHQSDEGSFVEGTLRGSDVTNILAGKLWLQENTSVSPARWILSKHREADSLTGMYALTSLFKKYDLSLSEDFYAASLQDSVINTETLSILSRIRDLKNSRGLASFIISCFPVIPIRYRPASLHTSKQQDFDYFYTAIAQCAANYHMSQNPDDLVKVYDYITLFLGIAGDEKKESLMPGGSRNSQDADYVDLRTYFTKKQSSGRIREMMAKKRMHRSGRSVIVPFSDSSISPMYVGIPYFIAIDIYSLELVSLLKKTWQAPFEGVGTNKDQDKLAMLILKNAVIGNEFVLDEIAGKTEEKKCRVIKEMIKNFVENQIILFGRQPSLHEFSMRAFKVIAVEGKAIQVHPLVCLGFNADFDGDTGYVIAPFTEKACRDIWKNLSVVNGIVNPGTGNIILEPSQDILLGLYYATSFEKNVLTPSRITPIHYNALKTLLADLDLGIILPGKVVTLQYKNQVYISTAGRLAFNSLLPDGFTERAYVDKYDWGVSGSFKALRYDYVVSGRVRDPLLSMSVGAIFKDLFEEYGASEPGREKLVEYFQAISEFGFKWSERSGISFNIGDLERPLIVEDFLRSVEKVSIEIDRQYSMGLMSAEARKEEILAVYSEARSEEFFKDYMSSFDRTNNIFMIYDSKAKGSEDQIMQSCGMLGILQKTKTDTLDVPITSNYARGLSSFEMFQTSYSTRLGILSIIMGTQEPGELTRTLVYAFSGLFVSEACCSTKTPPLRIRYERLSDFLYLDNKRIDVLDITGCEIVDEEVLKYDKVCKGTGRVTKELLDELSGSGLPWFDTVKGRVHFDVKFPSYLKKLLLYRTLNNKSYSDLISRKYISDRTIQQIELERPRYLDVMLLLNCLCRDSICADSYGLRYDPIEPVQVGAFVGFEAAQSIGEPSAQLTMDLSHKGGKAGASIGGGISVMKSAIQSGNIKIDEYGLYSPVNGYVKIDGSVLIIDGEDGSTVSVNILSYLQELMIKDGSYVTVGQALTRGVCHPLKSFVFDRVKTKNGKTHLKSKQKSLIVNPTAELVAKVRYELASIYDYIYSGSRINILGRHFEIAAFMQTSHGTVINSVNEDYKVGESYFIGDLLQADNVDFVLTISRAKTTIARNAGSIVASGYQDAYHVIATSAWSGAAKERSPLSAVLTGSPITQKGITINNLTDEIDHTSIKYIKKRNPVMKKAEEEAVVVFESNTEFASDPVPDADFDLDFNALFNGAQLAKDIEAEQEEFLLSLEKQTVPMIGAEKLNKF